MFKNKKRLWFAISSGFVLALSVPLAAWAQSSSPNYRIEEGYFGTGGEVDASSPNYRSRQSTGSLGVGNTNSTNFDANTGSNVQNEPFLEAATTGASVDFGALDHTAYSSGAAQAGGCNCSFYVRTYLSSQYVVITASQPPTSENGDALDAKTTLGVPSSSSAVEEFGINLVDNSSPDIGSNPSNQPDNTFADGEAGSGYSTPNQFKYGVGNIIARSQATPGNPAIGLTNYTISYIAKPALNTPAGTYIMRHDLIVAPTF